jgi:2-keto-3-deoxy-L-rhamnonate aldolase RhmA
VEQYAEWNNSEIALVPIIETAEALDDVDAICAHPDVKMLYFAPGNLSAQLGLGMQGVRSPRLQAAHRKVLDAAARHGVAMVGGLMGDPTPEVCRMALEDGVRVFMVGIDTLGFRSYCEQTVAAFNAAVADTDFKRPLASPSGF